MNEAVLKLRSSIKPSLKRYSLFRGTLLAALGASILLFGGIRFPATELSHWGWLLILVAIMLITSGLLPYRRLCRLEMKPHELILSDDNTLHFVSGGHLVLSIPLVSIKKTSYIEFERTYGIAIWLKNPPPEKIMYDKKENLKQFGNLKHYFDCQLFLPYFTLSSYEYIDSLMSD